MKKLSLHAGWQDKNPIIGTIYIDNVRGKETYSFEYDNDWLAGNINLMLDPDIQLFAGRQYLSGKEIYGFLQDISPDRWGRKLIERRETIISPDKGVRQLMPSDYMLAVQDYTRTGGIRVSADRVQTFISSSDKLKVPPMTKLRELEQAVEGFEKTDKDEEKWLNTLFAPGSSLGGARPKANVMDADNSLWIAKFPSSKDELSVCAWEKVAQDLARDCELKVTDTRYTTISGKGVFLSKRFDRNGEERVHFASAMTLLGHTDGDNGGSYEEIADLIREHGSSPKEDLKELWKRVVFGAAINNTDDHLRNHAFILNKNGWRLSPVYDINPSLYETPSLMVSSDYPEKNANSLINTAGLFGVSKADANDYIKKCVGIVSQNWKKYAEKYNIPNNEQKIMKGAFRCDMLK